MRSARWRKTTAHGNSRRNDPPQRIPTHTRVFKRKNPFPTPKPLLIITCFRDRNRLAAPSFALSPSLAHYFMIAELLAAWDCFWRAAKIEEIPRRMRCLLYLFLRIKCFMRKHFIGCDFSFLNEKLKWLLLFLRKSDKQWEGKFYDRNHKFFVRIFRNSRRSSAAKDLCFWSFWFYVFNVFMNYSFHE